VEVMQPLVVAVVVLFLLEVLVEQVMLVAALLIAF
jgi:hypothetical protein